MASVLSSFLDDYMPHGYCLLWRPELVWTHVVSDALIALAYFSIPIALIRFVRRRKDIQFGGIFWLFAVFIMACGMTHVMAIWTLWNGDYGIEAILKVITAIASVMTAIVLWPLIPRALALPSTQQLRTANETLAVRVSERDSALAALQVEATERLKAEAALLQSQKIEAIGQLTGGIAHDFNNLLQAVSGNIELIARQAKENEKISRLAANAATALDRGKKLTGQLLAFARTQQLQLQPVPLLPTISNMNDLLQRTLGPHVALETQVDDPLWHVLADQTQLELALLNLAINARDAMPDGGHLAITTAAIVLTEASETLAAGHYIDIMVSDTGTGMSPEVRDRAIEPFFTTKAQGKGTGLGLSMVFGIARQSGGSVMIDSHPGEGTTVTLRLQQVPPVPSVVASPETGPAIYSERLDGLHILVIDDDDAVRASLVETLRSVGASVADANGGAAGLALLEQATVDAVLLDYAMPDMNGATVAKHIAERRPMLPIVFASGYADSEALDTAVGNKVSMLRKPFGEADLVAALQAAVATNLH